MSAPLSIFNFKIPKAAILFLVLAAGFESALFWGGRVPDYALKKKIVEASAIQAEVLFIGDSSLTADLDLKFFEQDTGLSAYAYGSAQSLGILSYYLLLRHYLRYHPAPRYLVITVVPQTWSMTIGQSYNHLFDYYFHGDPELFQALQEGLTPALFFRCFILSRLPSILNRAYLNDFGFAGRRKLYEEEYEHSKKVRADLIAQKGARLIEDGQYQMHCIKPADAHGAAPSAPSAESRYYLGKLLRLAEQRKMRVFYVASPIAGECYSEAQIEGAKAMNRLVLQENPALMAIQPEVLAYPQESFANTAFHLNKTHARRFTRMITEKFKQVLLS